MDIQDIYDGYSDVRKLGIRVEKIVLSCKDYYEFMYGDKHVIFNNFLNNPDRMTCKKTPRTIGQLFGISVEIGEKSKVCGPQGWIPSSDPRNLIYGIEVEIGGIQSKLRNWRNRGCNHFWVKKGRGEALGIENVPKNELQAIETLREMISETEYRKYVKYGFILVKGSSTKVYQIFRTSNHVKVWNNGKLVEEVCVYIPDRKVPPTDKLIAFKVMIETNEEDFKKLGNVYKRVA